MQIKISHLRCYMVSYVYFRVQLLSDYKWTRLYCPLSRVVKAKAGSSHILTWTAWVRFPPSPMHDTCLLCSAMSGSCTYFMFFISADPHFHLVFRLLSVLQPGSTSSRLALHRKPNVQLVTSSSSLLQSGQILEISVNTSIIFGDKSRSFSRQMWIFGDNVLR
jgi:hypothetical protein